MSGAALDLSLFARVQGGFKDQLSAVPAPLLPFAAGKLSGVPIAANMQGFVYNPQMFDLLGLDANPDWTWDDLLIVADKLYAHTNFFAVGKRVAGGLGLNTDRPDTLLPFFWSNGTELLSNDGLHNVFDTPATRETAQWLAALATRPSVTIFSRWSDVRSTYAAGRLGMFVGSPIEAFSGIRTRRGRVPGAWLPYPRAPRTDESVTILDSVGVIINPHTTRPVGSLELIRWLLGDGQRYVIPTYGLLPVTLEAVLDEVPPADVDIAKAIYARAADGRTLRAVPGADGEPVYPADAVYKELPALMRGTIGAGEFVLQVRNNLDRLLRDIQQG